MQIIWFIEINTAVGDANSPVAYCETITEEEGDIIKRAPVCFM